MKAIMISGAVLLAALILVAIVGAIALWFKGGKTVALPGLGIVVTTPILLSALVLANAVLGILIFLLWRN